MISKQHVRQYQTIIVRTFEFATLAAAPEGVGGRSP